ncbi:4Fe-4S binding domain protein [uncultured Desulfobacterium sp.]|uniref:4Fe-4S binding domain protein n=1 Tax=uncultured Desulfobacterium sp. TaxID=201089 RepID=A0A445N270_9BACT|nr:4Fe-4S binding domain protein [uncultured Desulfobacterium sp.]
MASSKVFYSDLRASHRQNLMDKLTMLMDHTGIRDIVKPRSLVALKLHFGEKGNVAFIRPVFIRHIVDKIKELGGVPFLTDANTLYAGSRSDSVTHINTAIANGFAYSTVNAPIIIADGLRGASISSVAINQETIKVAHLAKEIVESDILISIAHFKGHELSGFGGTIKNLGMGCASRRGKLDQHSGLSPKIKRKKCIGCGECINHCSQHAISLMEDNKAMIDPKKCIGCGECILICPNGLIDIDWGVDMEIFQKKMAEYCVAVLRNKQDKALFINFLSNISPACDCYGHNDAAIVHDIGILASRDPVAIDQASVDLVNQMSAAEGSCIKKAVNPGDDKFRDIYPKIDWNVQLRHAERIGLGSKDYEIVPIQAG